MARKFEEDYKQTLELLTAKGNAVVETKDPKHFKEGLSRYKEWMRVKGTLHFAITGTSSGKLGELVYSMEITYVEAQLRRGRSK